MPSLNSTLRMLGWFDEPTNVEPGSSPYKNYNSLAEAGEEKDKKKDKTKEKQEALDIVTVLDSNDVHNLVKDNKKLDELLKLFPMLGEKSSALDVLIASKLIVAELLPVEEATALGEKLGIDWATSEFPVEQFIQGIEVELEHGLKDPETNVTDDDIETTAKIAWAHLKEMPDYYTQLKKMEDANKTEKKGTKKMGGNYLMLCPHCKSIQRAYYWEPKPCEVCGGKIPPYYDSHLEEQHRETPREPHPSQYKQKWQTAKVATKGIKLDKSTIQEINMEFTKAGLDGNGRFEKPGHGLNTISEILDKYGLQMSDLPGADYKLQTEPSGRVTSEIEKVEGDPFTPIPIENTMVAFSWYKFEDYLYECLAYLS